MADTPFFLRLSEVRLQGKVAIGKPSNNHTTLYLYRKGLGCCLSGLNLLQCFYHKGVARHAMLVVDTKTENTCKAKLTDALGAPRDFLGILFILTADDPKDAYLCVLLSLQVTGFLLYLCCRAGQSQNQVLQQNERATWRERGSNQIQHQMASKLLPRSKIHY